MSQPRPRWLPAWIMGMKLINWIGVTIAVIVTVMALVQVL